MEWVGCMTASISLCDVGEKWLLWNNYECFCSRGIPNLSFVNSDICNNNSRWQKFGSMFLS
jgi:hypothetical protein